MFQIIVVGGPARHYVGFCLESLLAQTEKDWKAQVVLDPMGDDTYDIARPYVSDKIQVYQQPHRMYAIPNILEAIKRLSPADEDILVTVDADDWLYDPQALKKVKEYYEKYPTMLLTHGTWEGYPDPKAVNNSAMYYQEEFAAGVRRAVWKGTHLRTFKYKLWKHIKDEDLRDARGEYFRCAWDLAFMWPMMEMAGYDRFKYIPEKLYVYNRETPDNDEKLRSAEQQANHRYLMTRPPYQYREVL